MISHPGVLARWPGGWRKGCSERSQCRDRKSKHRRPATLAHWGGAAIRGALRSSQLPDQPSPTPEGHGFLDLWPTVSRKGVGRGAGDMPYRRHLARSQESLSALLPHPQPVAQKMPRKSKGCPTSQPFAAARTGWGSHLLSEAAPAMPSASWAEGDPKVPCPGECSSDHAARQ